MLARMGRGPATWAGHDDEGVATVTSRVWGSARPLDNGVHTSFRCNFSEESNLAEKPDALAKASALLDAALTTEAWAGKASRACFPSFRDVADGERRCRVCLMVVVCDNSLEERG